jgi:hypothetical protein
MAQGRFINVSVAEDERLNSLSVEAQMMYLMAIPHLDRDGLINGNPSALIGKVCPLRPKMSSRVPHIIDEWVNAGLVIRYAAGDGVALWFKGFAKNNPLTHYTREKASRFPAPPGYIRAEKGLVSETELPQKEMLTPTNEASGETPDISGTLPEESGNSPREVEVEVEVRSEVEVEEKAKAAEPPAFLRENDSDKDGRFTMQLVSDQNLFGLFRSDAKKRAAALEETYRMEDIRRAVGVMVERHLAMVDKGERGVQDAVGFLAKILAEDFKTAEDKRLVKVEVLLAPSEFHPNGHTVYDKMSLASARQSGFKIVEYLQ